MNNVSQLAAFAKRDDLSFFLKELCGAEYLHEIRLAPTQEGRCFAGGAREALHRCSSTVCTRK